MKFALITAITALSTLASGMVILDPDMMDDSDIMANVYRPSIAIVIREAYPDTAYPPSNTARVSRSNGSRNVKTLLGFKLPAFPGKPKSCTISFSRVNGATGSRQLQVFTTGGYPAYGDTWNKKPYTDIHKGTFQVSTSGPGQVLGDYGLTFPCPKKATSYGYEVQPVNDDDYVSWDITTRGFIITAH